jgi:hypothetical protein
MMMKITQEDLLKPEKAGPIIQYVIGLPNKARRQQLILKITKINVLLAAQCLSAIISKQEELQVSIKQQALQRVEIAANPDEVQRAILALFELKDYKQISQVFAQIQNPARTFYRRVIQGIISKNADRSELLFSFLNILFENLQKRARPQTELSEQPTHTLWLWAVESLPEDIFISGHQQHLARFYRFFVLQQQYSPTLHLLPEKFGEFQDEFEKIVARYQNSAWQRQIYLNLIRRNPSAEWAYIAKVQSTNRPLSVVVYNQLIHHVNRFKTAVSLFEEMQPAGLRPDEITYSTLINQSPTFEQGFELFEAMKQAGLTPDEITYSTLINQSQTFEQGFELFEAMKQAGLTPNEISYNTLINQSQTFEQGFELFEAMKQAGLTPNEISYNTLINQSQTFEQGFELFEAMKNQGLEPNVISFNILLKKATKNKQPLHIILALLDEMISRQIKPQVGRITKQGQIIEFYTVEAVQDKLRKSQKPYKKWVAAKREQLQHQPLKLQLGWEYFFSQTLND